MVWGVAAALSSTDTIGVAKVICRTRGSQTRSAFRTIRFFKVLPGWVGLFVFSLVLTSSHARSSIYFRTAPLRRSSGPIQTNRKHRKPIDMTGENARPHTVNPTPYGSMPLDQQLALDSLRDRPERSGTPLSRAPLTRPPGRTHRVTKHVPRRGY